MKKNIGVEIFVWIITIVIAFALLFPVMSEIDYKYDWFNILQLIIIITYFRWIVYFDRVVLFENTWIKMISIPLLIISGFALVNTGQYVILLLENQNLIDIVKNVHNIPAMSQLELYNLYQYIHNLLIFTTWISGGISVILAIRIIASYIGYKSEKLSKYLEVRKEVKS